MYHLYIVCHEWTLRFYVTFDLWFQIVRGHREVLHGRTTSRAWTHYQSSQVVAQLVVLLVLPLDDLTIGCAISQDLSRRVAQPYNMCYYQCLAAIGCATSQDLSLLGCTTLR
jgi:hypothetical protein